MPLFLRADRGLRGGEAGDGDAVGGARNVGEADVVGEGDGFGFATVLAANADFEAGFFGAAVVHREFHQAANAFLIEHLEGVVVVKTPRHVVAQKLAGVVAREGAGGLRGEMKNPLGELSNVKSQSQNLDPVSLLLLYDV